MKTRTYANCTTPWICNSEEKEIHHSVTTTLVYPVYDGYRTCELEPYHATSDQANTKDWFLGTSIKVFWQRHKEGMQKWKKEKSHCILKQYLYITWTHACKLIGYRNSTANSLATASRTRSWISLISSLVTFLQEEKVQFPGWYHMNTCTTFTYP